ncbi:hypothetical protein K2Y11_09620 [bacterium]|nr:hypothetical protein [bacterium]
MTTTHNSTPDDATNPFLGYLYQLRFALLGGLTLRDPYDSVAVEFLDDVQFATSNGTTLQLHQLKHSINKKSSLGPRSENLWKTIGNWSNKVSNKQIDLNTTNLYLNTSGALTSHSPLTHLKLHNRNEAMAISELLAAASSSSNSVVKDNLAKFQSLNQSDQHLLLSQIIVLDSEVNIIEAADEIERALAISSRPEDLSKHRQFLEGWFFSRIIESLTGNDARLIAVQEIRNHSVIVRDFLVTDELPGLPIAPIPKAEFNNEDPRLFVEQLRIICARDGRIRRAQTEHFQALTKRSEWSREGKLAIEELPKFDSRLIVEWQIRHESACSNSEEADNDTIMQEAQRVYKWVEEEAPSSSQLYIRRSFSEPFLIRGSYHMLSDRLEVGWHPRYKEMLANNSSDNKDDNP